MKNTKLKNLILKENQQYKDMLKELDNLFANMDWSYRMSDDFRVWKHGEKSWDRIYDLTKALIEGGYKKQTEMIWNKYYKQHKPWFSREFKDFLK